MSLGPKTRWARYLWAGTLAIALAESANLCLVGFARERHCAVYAHPERLEQHP